MTAMQHDNVKKSDIDENLQGPKIGLGLYALFPIVQQEVVVTEAHTHTHSQILCTVRFFKLTIQLKI